jgi:hypothetical protein
MQGKKILRRQIPTMLGNVLALILAACCLALGLACLRPGRRPPPVLEIPARAPEATPPAPRASARRAVLREGRGVPLPGSFDEQAAAVCADRAPPPVPSYKDLAEDLFSPSDYLEAGRLSDDGSGPRSAGTGVLAGE